MARSSIGECNAKRSELACLSFIYVQWSQMQVIQANQFSAGKLSKIQAVCTAYFLQ